MSNIKFLEDCVEYLVDSSLKGHVTLEKADHSFFYTVDRQINKKIPFTERQKALIIKKITEKYMSLFEKIEDIDHILVTTKFPLRMIDYRNEIKIINFNKDSQHDILLSTLNKKNDMVISVEFPFNRKYLNKILKIRNDITEKGLFYFKPGKGRIHYFQYSPIVITKLVEEFGNTKMNIDENIINSYNKITEILNSRSKYVSSIDTNGVFNVCEYDRKNNEDLTTQDIFLADRHRQHGMFVENNYEPKNLTEKIAYRNNMYVLASPSKYSVKEIISSINEISRFPMLVCIDEKKCKEQLIKFHSATSDYVPNNLQSVLFRSDNNRDFNDYVRDKNINNIVDSNTKIVYISMNSLPKILLKIDWKPMTTFFYSSFVRNTVDSYVNMTSDLRIFYEYDISPFRKTIIKYDTL